MPGMCRGVQGEGGTSRGGMTNGTTARREGRVWARGLKEWPPFSLSMYTVHLTTITCRQNTGDPLVLC